LIYTSLHNEKELLTQIAAGDRLAFKTLYDHYWNNIYSTSLAYLKSTEWAQDIVQDVFMKIWEKRTTLENVQKFSSFLYITTRNELVSALRKKWGGERLPENYLDNLPSDLLQPGHIIDEKETDERIQKAVLQLTPQQQQIFMLTRQQGLSHEQIAKKLGIEKRTVSNHATLALNKLRQALKDDPELFLILYGIFLPLTLF
jgi:RNA polymerase sigma-70 factor (family 1)